MEKNILICVLLDFYGPLLTETQFNCTDLYYNEDYSLAEISEHEGITRQGVRDSIKHAESLLIKYEEKLGLYKKQQEQDELLAKIKGLAKDNEEILSLVARLMEN